MSRPTETEPHATSDLGLDRPAGTPQAAPQPNAAAPTQPLAAPAHTRKMNLTTAQVGAAAAASATSAVGASFLGAGGTIAAAAVGSVISTVAGAFYTRSLETAQKRLRETTTVLVKRVPNDGAQRPGAVPTQLDEVDEPAVRESDADLLATVATPAAGDAAGGAGSDDPPGVAPAGRRRRPLLLFAGVAAAGFALAVFGISAAESLLGHPVSGGSGGTSVGRVIGTDSSAAEDEEAPGPETSVTPTAEPTESGTAGDEQPAEEPSPSAEPTEEAGRGGGRGADVRADGGTRGAVAGAGTGGDALTRGGASGADDAGGDAERWYTSRLCLRMSGMHARPVDGAGEVAPPPTLDDVARHYDEMDDVYRRVWSDHAHHGLWRTGRESVAEAVEALVDLVADAAGVGRGSRVVDVGSGYGATGRRLARERSCEVVSFTISPRQYEYARAMDAGDPRLRHELRDWLHNGLPDGDRDAAIAVESIGHMDAPAALREVHRVLAPGGRLVIADIVAGDDVPRWQVVPLLRRMERESHLRPLPTVAGLRAQLVAAGFEVAEVRDLTTAVRRTWPRAVVRFARRLPSDRAVRRVLFSDDYENSGFMLSIARMTVGYRVGAVRFVVATARRPAAEPSAGPGSF